MKQLRQPGWNLARIGMILPLLLLGAGTILTVKLTAKGGEEAESAPSTPVAVFEVDLQDGYDSWRSYTGRSVAARTSALAFELSGSVHQILVDHGDTVGQGQVLARLDMERLEAEHKQLKAERAELDASLVLARRTLERVSETFKGGHMSAQKLDESEANLKMTEARAARVDAALQTLAINIERSELKAPFAGTITARNLDEGAVVARGNPVLVITETGELEAEIGMSAVDARGLRAGGRFRLFDALRRPVSGDFKSIVSSIEGTTRTVKAVFRLDTGNVLNGELIHLRVPQHHLMQGAWIPVRAMTADVRGLWRVYKVSGQGGDARVTYENVQILYTDGERAYVTGSISDGDQLVAGGVNRLAPGQLVSVVHDGSGAGASR